MITYDCVRASRSGISLTFASLAHAAFEYGVHAHAWRGAPASGA